MTKAGLVSVLAAAALLAAPAMAQGQCAPVVVDLIAGQNSVAGSVTVVNDAVNLSVTYTVTGCWLLDETHMAAATSLAGIPQTKKGSPKVGNFENAGDHEGATTVTYTIPLADLMAQEGTPVYVAAHAVVRCSEAGGGTETAWADGRRFVESNWSMYIVYTVCGIED